MITAKSAESQLKTKGLYDDYPFGIIAALDSAIASWSARSPLPLFSPRWLTVDWAANY